MSNLKRGLAFENFSEVSNENSKTISDLRYLLINFKLKLKSESCIIILIQINNIFEFENNFSLKNFEMIHECRAEERSKVLSM